ncbi:MAG: DUF2089 domain-containing protein [Fimbriimonadaceae bacterium]|jgi:hypothetical protein|nr:DUF2089 domain-containing protein [Fimbriimonadaceae bacterium]
MSHEDYHPIPPRCPITGEDLYVSELTSVKSGITFRGKFALPETSHLEEEHQKLLDLFLRSRGVISTMERELGLSYPTVKARLDSLFEAMGLEPLKAASRPDRKADAKRILKQLEDGEISGAEAKKLLEDLKKR